MTNYEIRYNSHPEDAKEYGTDKLRDRYLIQKLMEADTVNLTYSMIDRVIVGGAVPVKGALKLETIDPLRAEYFLERRELGVFNVGGTGTITVDGKEFALNYKDALYITKGSKDIEFKSDDASKPAHFYLLSTPAHKVCETKLLTLDDAEKVTLGSLETSNHRQINKMMVHQVLETCQLQMGMTELKPGSVWNTMPAHVHPRRMEAYFYFEVPQEQSVCHFMGEPQETRHLWMQNEEAVLSPEWSIHSAAGTSNYIFIWGMGGENIDYSDMDHVAINELR